MAELVLGRLKFKWQGDWATSTAYIKDDVVRYGGNVYVAVENHTSNADFYVDLTATRWQLMVAGQEWKGGWATSTYYKINDIVSYGPSTYICTEGHTSAAKFSTDLDATRWQVVTRGIGTEGAWTEGVRYQVNDVVTYGGAVYICILDHSSDDSTDTRPTNADYWLKFVDGFQFEGDYDNATDYQLGDVVIYGEWAYIAIQDTTGNAPDAEGNLYWEVLTKGYYYRGTWNNAAEFKPGEIVQLGGDFWACIKTHTNQVPPDNTYWVKFSTGFKYSGTYSNALTYYPGEIVTYGGNLYSCQTQTTANDPSDTNYWAEFVKGFNFTSDYSDSTVYKPGDVTKYGARMYLMHTQSGVAATTPTDITYWKQLSDGLRWRGSYSGATIYILDDVVEYAQSSYVCTLANQGQTPSAGAPYWELVAQGDSNAVMTTRGDIIIRNATQATRLPIGPAGSYLYSDGTDVTWGHQTPQTEFYVSLEGNDSNDGRTPATSWRTIEHACEQTYSLGQSKISIAAGTYNEVCPMRIGRGVVIEGNGLGAVTIAPDTTNDKGYGVGISKDGSTPNANSDVFWMNNGSRLRNIVFRNFSTGSVMTSLDPGSGPDDTSVWITSQSPYVQNCTSFSPGGTGMLIDGALHNGGYKSAVANDWTQINSDGIGIHVKSDARVELVSVFTYYCDIGYLAESGGKIRAVVGNNSYGEYGAVARGFSQSEAPLDARLQLSDETLDSVLSLSADMHIKTLFKDEVGNTFYAGHTGPTGTNVTSTFDNTSSTPIIMKLNAAFALDWLYEYDSAIGEIVASVELAESMFFAGKTYDGADKGWIMKLSKAGEFQWQKTIGNVSSFVDLASDGDNLYALGVHSSDGMAVVKLNPAGVEVWSRTLSPDDESSLVGAITPSSMCFADTPTTSTDTYTLAGDATAEENLYVAGRDTVNDITLIARIDKNGNYITGYTVGDVYVNKLRLDTGNGDGIYLMGAGYYIPTGTTKNPIAFRMSVDGTVQWQSQLADSTENGEWLDVLPFGNDVYLSGYMNEGTNNNNSGLLARYTSNGSVDWTVKVDNGTNNVALYGVELDGVNVISAGIENANGVVFNTQRDKTFGVGTVTSGSYAFADRSLTNTSTTIALDGVENLAQTSRTLGSSDTLFTLNQAPSQTRTIMATRDGFAGIGTGTTFQINSLTRKPKDGSVLQIDGDSETYFVIDVSNYLPPSVESGNNPNTQNILTLNKTWLQDETIGWIDYQITNGSIWGDFTYNQTKCERDIEYLVDAVRYDMAFNSNYRSVSSALRYYDGTAGVVTGSQDDQTIASFGQAKTQTAALLSDATAISRSNALWDEIIDIVTNGAGAADAYSYPTPSGGSANSSDSGYLNARNQIVANKTFMQDEVIEWIADQVAANTPPFSTGFTYNDAQCRNDVGKIVDALIYDLTYGGNLQSYDAARAYYVDGSPVYGSGEKAATLAAMAHLKAVIGYVIDENTSWTKATSLLQDTTGTAGSAAAKAAAESRIQEIYDYLDGDGVTLPTKSAPDITWTSATLQAELGVLGTSGQNTVATNTTSWINGQIAAAGVWNTEFTYDSTTCRRDVGLIVDALINDANYATNADSIEAARAYYTTASIKGYNPGEEAETIAAMGFLKTLVGHALNQTTPSDTGYPYTGTVQQTGLPAAEAGGITLSDNNMQEIINILTNGRDTYTAKIGYGTAQISIDPSIPSNKTPDDDTHIVFREAFSQVRMTGHDFLDIGTGGFADTNYPVIIQEDYTQQPSQDREVDIEGGGRVFYVTTDQDGDFRVGDYFKVEQATGRATLSSEEFDLTGLNELQLGSITAGKQGATINEFSTDGTMSDNSDTAVPTERAVVTYVSSQLGGFDVTLVKSPSTNTRVETNYNSGEEKIRMFASGTEHMVIHDIGIQAKRYRWLDQTSASYTASAGDNIMVNTQTNAITITLPVSPTIGDTIRFIDATSNFDTNALTVDRNGQPIQGTASDLTVNTRNAGFGLVYYNSTYGWRLIEV